MTIFHLACPVKDKESTRIFYRDILGCSPSREGDHWIDFNFYGHQVTFHVRLDAGNPSDLKTSVDNKTVPARHFGAVLEWQDWHELRDRLDARGIDFILEPQIRFKGKTGEQATMFILDPSGNALEFKSYKDPSQVFAT